MWTVSDFGAAVQIPWHRCPFISSSRAKLRFCNHAESDTKLAGSLEEHMLERFAIWLEGNAQYCSMQNGERISDS